MTRYFLFEPRTQRRLTDAGLLILRLWIGLTLLIAHGWSKLVNFSQMEERFPDVLGIGSPAVNLGLAVAAEVGGAALVTLGLITHLGALIVAVNLGVAFFAAHGARLSGDGNGELAFIYLAGFVALLLTCPGRYSLDALWFGSREVERRDGSVVVPHPGVQR